MADQTFTFTLDSFRITDTRSLHEDTDYVSFTLGVDKAGTMGAPQTLTKYMGDVNNGTFQVNLSFPKVAVGPTDLIVVNYLIVNTGHKNPSQTVSTLENAGTQLAIKGGAAAAGAIAGSAIPGLGTALGAIAGWLAGEIVSIINANCDGPVAAEQNRFTLSDLMAKTAAGKFTHTTKHPGIDSAHGCGSNSVYYATWHIQRD